LRYSDTPADAQPGREPDPNAPFAEDGPDDTAQVVDPLERGNLPVQRQFMSAREWHNYTMADRRDDQKEWHWLWNKGPLAEQYVLGSHIQIEQHEQEEVKKKQKVGVLWCVPFRVLTQYIFQDLRSILPKDLLTHLGRELPGDQALGKVFLATKHWQGSRRHMQQCYADAQTMFSKLGKPHLFLTWTGNPHWEELQDLTRGTGLSWNHLPLHVTRIFWSKFEELMKDISER
jgi:hypothetical protein